MKPNFLKMARTMVEAAKAKLNTDCDDDVVDAALRLRMSMEALTYHRSEKYEEDLGPEQMRIWQPKQLMDRILEVDPHAGYDKKLSIGKEPSYGKQPDQWTSLGTEHVLTLGMLKKHYNALGSYLHIPTLRQFKNGKTHDPAKLRSQCTRIIEQIDVVLSSKVWIGPLGHRIKIDCHECGEQLRRRIPYGKSRRDIVCWNCTTRHRVWLRKNKQVEYEALGKRITIPCVSEYCKETHDLRKNDLQCGKRWKCGSCGKQQELTWRAIEMPSDDK